METSEITHEKDDLDEIIGDEHQFMSKPNSEEIRQLKEGTHKSEVKEKDHLVVLVHGLHGSISDLYSIQLRLEASYPNVFVVIEASNL